MRSASSGMYSKRVGGGSPGPAARQEARVVLDARAAARCLDHLDIEIGALLQALRLQQLARLVELLQPDLQLLLDQLHRLGKGGLRRDVMAVGVELDLGKIDHALAGEGIELPDRFDLVAEERELPGPVFHMGREDLQGIAADAEGAALEIGVVALVMQLDQPAQQLLAVDLLSDGEGLGHGRIGLGRADAIDAGDRGDDDHVAPLEQRPGGRMAHAVDLLVDRAFLLDIGVGPRHIGLGLVVVVIGDEILHRVLGKEALHLAIELGGQRLVRRQDQGRALQMLDDMGHGEGLARAGNAQQDLVALLALEPRDELDDGLGLVAGGLVVGDDLEGHAPGRPGRPADEGQGACEGRSLGVAEHGQDIACDPALFQ